MRFLPCFFAAVAAFVAFLGGALAADISGKVVNRDGRGVSQIRVAIGNPLLAPQNASFAVTRDDGTYTITDVAPGAQLIGPVQPSKYFDPSLRPLIVGSNNLSGINFVLLGTDETPPRVAITSPSSGGVDNTVVEARGTASDDSDRDQIRDPGESGVLAVLLRLSRTNNVGVQEDWNWQDLRWESEASFESIGQIKFLIPTPTRGAAVNWSATLPRLQSGFRYRLNAVPVDRALLPGVPATSNFEFSTVPVVTTNVSGRVLTHDGRGVPNVPVVLALNANQLAISPALAAVAVRLTDVEGRYTFPAVTAGNYWLAATRVGAFFEPTLRPITVASTPLSDVNFRVKGIDAVPPVITLTTPAAPPNNIYRSLPSISGTVEDDADNDGVRDAGESGVLAVSVTLMRRTAGLPPAVWNWRTSSWSVQPLGLMDRVKLAALSGEGMVRNWSINLPASLPDGTYAVVATPIDSAFRVGRPAHGSFVLHAVQSTSTVAGRITLSSGEGIPDVVVRRQIVGSQTLVAVRTNSAGFYEFANVPPGTYQITPIKEGFSFTPPSRTVRVTSTGLNNVTFLALPRIASSEVKPGIYRGRFRTSNPNLTGADLYLTVAVNGRVAGSVHYDGDAEDEFETLSGTINLATGAVRLTSTFLDSEGLNTLTLTGSFNSVNGAGRGSGTAVFENENDFRQNGTWSVEQRLVRS